MEASNTTIYDLPPEILAQVLSFVSNSYTTVDAGPPRRDLSVNQVNALSSVCSSWRRIALGTPQLWSCVRFERLDRIDHIPLWLERAGRCSLDVTNVVLSDDREMNEDLFLIFSRIERVRSMILRSNLQIMNQWISGWCTNGVPRTMTTLALSAPYGTGARFPAQGETIHLHRLNELFHSLNTLYLKYLRVEWDWLRCHNLVTLTLDSLTITAGSLRNILITNCNLQYIRLGYLKIINASESATLPPIQLIWLDTLILHSIKACEYAITIVAPGDCGLTLKTTWTLSDALRRNFIAFEHDLIAFCKRSNVTTLYFRDLPVLHGAIAAQSKIEILHIELMNVDGICDLIVPRANINNGSSLERAQSRLPYLHSLYLCSCRLGDPEGLRRVISACSVREIGIDSTCSTNSGILSGIDDLKQWLGPGVDVSFVMKEREEGYNPFR